VDAERGGDERIAGRAASVNEYWAEDMCGRFTLHSRDRIRLKGWAPVDLPFPARYNIAPGQEILVLADFGRGIQARMLRWGLIPSWSTDGKGFINARAETLEDKPSFSESFRFRRCLIPADGFFEWRRTGREKRPFYIYSDEEAPLMFAGIWDTWRNLGESITSCAIITTAANEMVAELHDRMPAILSAEVRESWLDRRTNRTELLRMLTPFPAAQMKTYPVSASVNSPDNDSIDLLTREDVEKGNTLSLF
jgi:putative SOS response-associated peptidase YedK